MPLRKILFLSVILAFLAGVAFFVQGPGKRHQAREPALLFPGFEADRIGRVTVTGAGDSEPLFLKKEEAGGWTVAAGGKSFPADGEMIERALDDLKEARVESVVSTNVEKKSLFGVGEKVGTALRLENAAGAVAEEFIIGRQGPDPFTGYLLRRGEKEVLLVSPSLRGVFTRGVDGWRDRKIVNVAREGVTGVVIREAEDVFTLSREEGGDWKVEGRVADRQLVEDYLDRVVGLKAAAFAEEEELSLAGLDEPSAAITVTAGGESLTLFLGAPKEEARQRYLRAGDAPTVYLVSRYTADSLLPKEADFSPADPEEGGTTEP
jgi:hypothetical protein